MRLISARFLAVSNFKVKFQLNSFANRISDFEQLIEKSDSLLYFVIVDRRVNEKLLMY